MFAFLVYGLSVTDYKYGVDEIEFTNGKGTETTIIGGAGTYAALGARLAAGARNAHGVGWIVDQGSDFPPEFKSVIDRWQTSCLFRSDLNRLTTRAWNGYGADEYRCRSHFSQDCRILIGVAFKYLTPKLRLEEHSLIDDQVLASSFHMVCSPKRCITLIEGISARRSHLRPGLAPPIFVWEPVPDLCTPQELENMQEAAGHVNVVSPNGSELKQFFAGLGSTHSEEEMVQSIKGTDEHDETLSVVVRNGADGSRLYLGSKMLHLRAYHQDCVRVVDPTGGGNTYLGAMAIGMTNAVGPGEGFLEDNIFSFCKHKRWSTPEYRRHVLATLHATIAASYAIEQVGIPSLVGDKEDCWNGQLYQHRFAEYIERERAHILEQIDVEDDIQVRRTHAGSHPG